MTAARTPADLKLCVVWLKQHGRAERTFAADLAGVFQAVGRRVKTDVLEALDVLDDDADGLTEEELDDVLDIEEIYEDVMEEARPAVRRMVLQGALAEFGQFQRTRRYAAWCKERDRGGSRHELDIDLPPDMAAAVDAHAEEILEKPYWRDLAETVRSDVARTVNKGLKDGKPTQAIADDLEDVLGEDGSEERAKRIARTETTAGLSAGHQAVREKLAEDGLVTGKRWVAILDEDVRPDHEEAHGQVVPVEEPFIVGGEEAMYPGDPELAAKQRVQ